MLADLHAHTQFSDGSFTPQQCADAAKNAGVTLLAVCDHNTVDGVAPMRAACEKNGQILISGTEIDCLCGPFYLHILGLAVDETNADLRALLKKCRDLLDWMSDDLIAAMEKDGQNVSVAEFNAFTRNAAHGGWKGIDYLAAKGYVGAYPDCMQHYKKYNIGQRAPFPQLEEVCRVIHAAGGKAIVAHPGDRLPQERAEFLAALALLYEAGIDGIECYYPSHSAEITRLCVDFCENHHLNITCGSDSHGDFARVIEGITYKFGAASRPVSDLQLRGIFDGLSK